MIFRTKLFQCLILIILGIGISNDPETVEAAEPLVIGVLNLSALKVYKRH